MGVSPLRCADALVVRPEPVAAASTGGFARFGFERGRVPSKALAAAPFKPSSSNKARFLAMLASRSFSYWDIALTGGAVALPLPLVLDAAALPDALEPDVVGKGRDDVATVVVDLVALDLEALDVDLADPFVFRCLFRLSPPFFPWRFRFRPAPPASSSDSDSSSLDSEAPELESESESESDLSADTSLSSSSNVNGAPARASLAGKADNSHSVRATQFKIRYILHKCHCVRLTVASG